MTGDQLVSLGVLVAVAVLVACGVAIGWWLRGEHEQRQTLPILDPSRDLPAAARLTRRLP